MSIDLNNPKHLIGVGLVLLFLFWFASNRGRLEERCDQRGGQVVTVGHGEDATDVCRFADGREVRLYDLE